MSSNLFDFLGLISHRPPRLLRAFCPTSPSKLTEKFGGKRRDRDSRAVAPKKKKKSPRKTEHVETEGKRKKRSRKTLINYSLCVETKNHESTHRVEIVMIACN